MTKTHFKKAMSIFLSVLMVLSCWVWVEPHDHTHADAATLTGDSNYLFAYFTGTSIDGQTIHLAVSKDGLNYTALRNNEPVIIPSKGTGCVRDPYLWYNEQDNYYYILATDLDFTDTGSDYSDNSESFIIWRSKDLVHWYDETMIDVKAMSHLIGDVGNMQAVWAPQVLWDGTSYVVYFSLQCNFTGIGNGWNNLEIVYLRTTDLLDQDAYYEFGVIHDPQVHVIDADIIKKPGTEQYYMFYKAEADAIQSIYYMVSDNGPTGPYYAPGNANGGKGPKVFADLNVNIEGCNSFFDDNGNLITYVDEYDYTNAAGQKEAHFHVSSSSDFQTFTKLPESSYNINTLSPRHGSVVKITDEEYNRLVNNAYGITSSSFPATEELSDHLVGRYFTTGDYTYNAANGKNDLVLTDGAISTAQEDTGEYFAFFEAAGAEIDLNSLIPGDLNIKDGFTITFTALVPAALGYNSRFFDISNNWSQRTSAEECYLHMSPVAENNGLYVGAFNGPKSTTSWTWASQGKNYNDDQKHEYMISFADGNMIMYIDGELAMKRDRFNFNAEYGDNFLDDNWFRQIGNSKMRIGKSEWADPLFTGYLQDFCIYDCSMSYYDIKTIQNEQDIEAGIVNTPVNNSSLGTAIPSWTHSSTSQMAPLAGTYFSNLLYSPQVTGMPADSNNPTTGNGAAVAGNGGEVYFGVYYANNTVLFVDGKNTPKMPVYVAGRINTNDINYGRLFSIYPIISSSDTSDCKEFSLVNSWTGWNASSKYHETVKNPDGVSLGYSSSTKGSYDLKTGNSQGAREIYYFANVLQLNEQNISFNAQGYQKYNLSWIVLGERSTPDGTKTPIIDSIYQPMSSSFNTYVVNLKPFIALKETITAEYDSIIKSGNYCPATIANYRAVVDAVTSFNPQTYNYASGAEAAVQQCLADMNRLIGEYNTAKSNLGACKKVILEGRDATCIAPGLTEGSYCEYCGEVYAEQQTTEKVPHTFGNQFTDNGVDYYVQCSVCGLKILVKQNEVRYENIFSFNEWFDSDSDIPNSGAITLDFTKDLITFANGSATGESVSGASGNVSRNYNMYAFPVTAGNNYVLEYTLVSKDATSDIFIFYYDRDGKHVGTYGGVVHGTNGASQIYTYNFTPVANAAYAELRFDSNDMGETVRFANIGVYEKESYDTYASQNPYSRLGFNTGESIELFTPKRIGYEFLGWYTSNGTKVTNTDQLTSSVTVYAKWREVGNSVLYNGNLFSLTEFAKTNDYKMQGSVLDGHVWADFEKGTFNTVSARDGLGRAGDAVNVQLDTYNTPGTYKVAVTEGEEYVYTATLANKAAYQTYLWFYNASGGAVTHPATGSQWINHSTNNSANGCVASWLGNTLVIRFTVPVGATHISFRMGTTGKAGFTQTFSNIGLYTASDYDAFVNGGILPSQTYVPDGENVVLAAPERTGYEFAGWYENKNGTGNALTDTSSMTADKTVYAKWNSITYTLTFALDGGTMTDAASKTYTNQDTFTLPIPTKDGFIFIGWKVTTADGNWVENGVCNGGDTVSGMSGNVTLTAQWINSSFTITWKNEDGTVIDTTTVNTGEMPTHAAPSKDADDTYHYTFSGWSPALSEVSGDTTYKATFAAVAHNWGDGTVTIPPTCTTEGEKTFTCTCGKTKTEKVGVAAHTPKDAVIENNVESTCTQKGSYETVVYCSVCNAELSREKKEVALKEHTPGSAATCTAPQTCTVCGTELAPASGHTEVEIPAQAPTCTETGLTAGKKCSVCGTVTVAQTEVAALGHKYSAVITTPTCENIGYTTYTCSVCDDSYTDNEVDALGHNYVGVETKAPTCTETGVMTYTCTNDASHTYTETIKENGHTLTQVEAKAPTCTEAGYEAYEYCSVCDYTTFKAVEAKGHTEGEAVIENNVEPTCTEKGSYETVVNCSVCDAELSRVKTEVEAKGHTPGAAATCTEPQKCTVCQEVLTEAKGHTEGEAVIENNVEPTCTEKGSYETVVNCSVCDAELSRVKTEVEAKGHTPGAAATCTEPQKCTVCQEVLTEAKGHTEGEAVIENNVEPTCTEKGSYETVVNCSVCDAELSRVKTEVEAKGHTPGAAATCTEPQKCTVCQEVLTEAKGHTEGEAVIENNVEPTCTEKGSYETVVNCSVCDAELSRVKTEVEAKGHIPGAEATCTEPQKCTVCQEVLTEAKGHTEGEAVIENNVEPTCTEKGSYETVVNCSVCDAELSRVKTEVEAKGHTPGAEATCTEPQKCTVCQEVLTEAKGHTEGEAVIENNVEPTCTEKGSYETVVNCSVCDAELSRVKTEVEAKGHTPGAAATCTEPQKCTVCQEVLTEAKGHIPGAEATCTEPQKCTVCQEVLTEAKGHTEGEAVIENNVEPTCTEKGSYETVVNCSVCDAELSRVKTEVEAKGHTPGAEATCTEPQKCTVCQEVLTEAKGHDYKAVVTAPTCTEEGFTTHTCSKCGDTYKDTYTDMLAHNYEEEVTKEPTCEDKGEKTFTCTACGGSYTEEIAANGHTLTQVEAKAETCEAIGWDAYEYCSVCDYTTYAEIPASGHDYDMTKSETNLTRPELVDGAWVDGFYTFTCNNDSAHKITEPVKRADYTAFSEALNKLEELLDTDLTDDAKAAIQDVLNKYNEMADNLIESEQGTLIEATEELTETFNDNVTALKTYTVTFVVDGKTVKTETVVSGMNATAPLDPTKAADADNHYSFSGWDNVFTAVTADTTVTAEFTAEAHTFTHTDKDDTYHTDKCACGYETDVEHSYNGGVVTTDPTCTHKGEKTFTCTICFGTKTEEVNTDANAHKWETVYTVDTKASCDAAGQKSYHCEYCDAINADSVVEIAKREHHIVDVDIETPATCTDTGIMNQKCDHEGSDEYEACTYTTTRVIEKDAENHTGTQQLVNYEDATCTEDGYTGDMQWSCCKVVAKYGETIEATGHTAGEAVTENFVDSSCYAEGSYDEVVYCSVCEAANVKTELSREEKVVTKKAHTAGEAVTEYFVDSSCYAEGSYDEVVYCSVCEAANVKTELSREEKVVTKKAHTAGEAVTENFVDSSCYAEGSYDEVVYCSVCEAADITEELSRTGKTVEKKEHTAGEAVTENFVDSSCYAEGSYDEVVYCSVCEAADITEELSRTGKTVEKKEHTTGEAVEENRTEATCTVDGSYEAVVYCSVTECNAELSRDTVVITASGHDYQFTMTVPHTCDDYGYDLYDCSRCDASEERNIVAAAHTGIVTDKAVEPTCEDTGLTEGSHCEDCGEILFSQEEIPATGHEYVGVVTKKAECEVDGEMTYTCSHDANHTYTEVIPMTGHTEEAIPAVDATCMGTGLTEGTKCSVCDKVIVAQTVIGAHGHNYVGKVTVEATCTQKGVMTYTCTHDASHTYTEEIALKAHTIVKVDAKAPECEAVGWDAYEYCSVCDYTTYSEIGATGHSYDRGVVTTEPTCDDKGVKTFTCTACEDSYTEDVAATGHDFDMINGVLTRPSKQADGTWADGFYTYACRHDASHTVTESVKRADYSEYDKLVDAADKILSLDIPNEDKSKLEEVLSNNAIPEDLIISEQSEVDAVLDEIRNVISEVYPDAGLTLVIKGNAIHYAGTVLDLKAVKVNEVVEIDASDVTWTSSDDNIVFFSNGKLFATGTGTVTLTATSGLLTASKTVTVIEGGNTRGIRFVAMDKMHYIVEDYFVIFNGASIRWSDDYSIRFRVHTYQAFPFETYIVYVNGKVVEPDADGYYTVPEDTGEVIVSISGAVYDDDGTGSGSKWSFWEWLLALIRKIINFFKNLFGIA